jgi:hypothetical protein
MIRKFIQKTMIMVFFSCIFIAAAVVVPKEILERHNDFSLENRPSMLVIGHSHSQYAFDDRQIENLVNISSAGQSYFYAYPKLKEVLEDNPQLKTVFIEFSNGQIERRMDDWIWGADKMKNYFPTFSPFISQKDMYLLFQENRKDFIPTISLATRENIGRMMTFDWKYSDDIGEFKPTDDNHIDSLLELKARGIAEEEIENPELSHVNLEFLKKMIDLCQQHNVKPILVRSPQHPEYNYLANEAKFIQIKDSLFDDIEFLDFNNFPLENTQYRDFGHLNEAGAAEFSRWFDSLVQAGLLTQKNMEKTIQKEIQKIRGLAFQR